MDTLRYKLPAPSSPATDAEWKAALDNANAQLQHQRIRYACSLYSIGRITNFIARQQNLALLQTYGSNAWRIQNHLLEATTKQTENAVEELKELVVEVNRERKNMQVKQERVDAYLLLNLMQDRVGRQLSALEKRWTELVSSVLQIEMANVALEAEITQLNHKADELAAAL